MKLYKKILAVALAAAMTVSAAVTVPVKTKAATKLPSGISTITKDKVYIYSCSSDCESYVQAFNEKYPEYAGLIKCVIPKGTVSEFPKQIDKVMKGRKAPSLVVGDLTVIPELEQKKYVVPMAKVGFNTAWYKNAYPYTKTLGKYNGKLTAIMTEVCPNAYVYDKKVAKKAFGKDDQKTIESKIKDIDTFKASAKKAKSKGVNILASSSDLKYMFLYSKYNTATVKNGVVSLPTKGINEYAKLSKTLVANKCVDTKSSMWSASWLKHMSDKKTLGYFGPQWFLDYSYRAGKKYDKKTVGIAEGPVASYWGGSAIVATNKVKNKGLVQLFLYSVTADQSILVRATELTSRCPNNKKAMQKVIKSGLGKNAGYANDPYVVWDKVAKKIKVKQLNIYGEKLDTAIDDSVYSYAHGDIDSLDSLNTSVKEFLSENYGIESK